MKRTVVLGIGNRLMMDDGIGVEVVGALMEDAVWGERVAFEIGETDFDYCMEAAIEAEYLIIIDSAITGKAPGEITVFPLSQLCSSKPGISLHNLHFLDLIQQFDQKKCGILIGIEPYQIDVHWGISRELKEKMSEIVGQVRQMITRYIEAPQ